MTFRFSVARLVVLLNVLVACGKREPPLEIAYVGPQTGVEEADSIAVRNVIEHYLAEINEAGGVHGRQVKLRVFDDENKSERAVAVAQDISASSVLGVIGHRIDTTSLAASPVYEEREVPVITPSAVHPDLTRKNKWYFRTTVDSQQQVLYAVAYIREVFRAATFSIIHVDHPDVNTWADEVEETAKKARIQVKARHALPFEMDKDRITAIVEAVGASPDPGPLFLMTDGPNGAEIIRQLRDAGIDLPILGPTSFATHRFGSHFRDLEQSRIRPHFYTDGIRILTPALLDIGSPRTTAIARWYARTYGRPPNLESLLAADAATLFVEGTRAVLTQSPGLGTAELRSAVRDWLAMRGYGNSIEGATGSVYFDETGNRLRSVFLAELQSDRVISAPVQLRLLPHIGSERDLPPGHEPERIVQIGEDTLYRTDIVYAGFKVHELGELNEKTLTFDADMDFWFRHREGIQGWNIRLLNASEDLPLGEPVEFIERNGVEYRRFRVRGTFDADVIPAPYGRHTLGFAFRHPHLTTDSMLYAFDFVGLGSQSRSGREYERFKEAQALLPANSSWMVYDGVFFQDKVYDTTRGRPEADGHPTGETGFSRLAFGVRIARSDLSPRSLTPSRLATPTALLAFLGTLVLVAVSRSRLGSKNLGTLWFFQAALAALLLLSAEKSLGDLLSGVAPIYYQQAFAMLFGALWWLVPAFFIQAAVSRFVWIPIERETERPAPSILTRIVALTIYLLAFFGIIAFVFDQKLTSLLATSGVVAMIIGLAIQINIANVFSGIAINMERPFRLGDWIMVHGRTPSVEHGTIGQVIDINWRTTRLKTTDNTVIVIPNAVISEKTVTNFMMPDERSRFEQLFYLDYAVPHEQGLELIGQGLTNATKSEYGPLADPKPKVRVNGTTELGVEYMVRYWLVPKDVSPAKARNTVTAEVLAAVRDGGAELSYPKIAIRGETQ
ncbi:MAG: ABC transporter substrate-binding protein [Myxococcota bacterium]